jgi:hypothetical protein
MKDREATSDASLLFPILAGMNSLLEIFEGNSQA